MNAQEQRWFEGDTADQTMFLVVIVATNLQVPFSFVFEASLRFKCADEVYLPCPVVTASTASVRLRPQ